MSDADDQMGGTGGERGPRPGDRDRESDENKKPDKADSESEQSFPASDPPANY